MLTVGDKSSDARIYACSRCQNIKAFWINEVASACELCTIRNKKQYWLPRKRITIVARDINKEFRASRKIFEKMADSIASFCGNMWFVYLHVIIFTGWLVLNYSQEFLFDPPPFGLLTLIVSLEAIFLASFILISENKHSRMSELRAKMDYQVNIKAEKGIAEILAILKNNKK